MRLPFTSGYHPEGDGQTECANQVLEQYLQVYTNYQQDDWVTLLPMAEFTYNNAMNATTGVSPFFANKGYHPEFTVDPQVETSLAKAQAFMVDLECVQAELKENIAQAQERYQKNADKHRMEAPELKIGDPSLRQGKVLQNQATIQETLGKEPGPIRHDRETRHPLCHPPSPIPVPLCPPSLSCITTATSMTQPIPSLTTPPTPPATH